VDVATEHGLAGLTKPRIAERAGCSPALVNHYWGPISSLLDAVVQRAVETEALALIARAMVEGHPLALGASEALRKRAALSILGR
jgi:AcrR family transcriptional regulator